MTRRLYVSIDIETSGPAPGLNQMLSIGCVPMTTIPDDADNLYLQARLDPSYRWDSAAAKVHGLKHDRGHTIDTLVNLLDQWCDAMTARHNATHLVMVGDNPAFDMGFVLHHCHKALGRCPFGWSGRRIGDLYAGLVGRQGQTAEWRQHRTVATHNAMDDAAGNAVALRWMCDQWPDQMAGFLLPPVWAL